jgi:hypothetical protein
MSLNATIDATIERLVAERDEARRLAEEWRNIGEEMVRQVGSPSLALHFYARAPKPTRLPWEVEK